LEGVKKNLAQRDKRRPFCVMKGSCSTTRKQPQRLFDGKASRKVSKPTFFPAQTRADELREKLEELAAQ